MSRGPRGFGSVSGDPAGEGPAAPPDGGSGGGAPTPGGEWLFLPRAPWRAAGTVDRRGFLRVAAGLGGGLLLCFTPTACREQVWRGESEERRGPEHRLDAYVRVAPDGSVTIRAPCPEIGQGVRTSLPMIVAGELGADWARCRFEQAPADDAYGGMSVGGSDSVADYWEPLRRAGATARTLLVAAAADRLGAPAGELSAADGRVTHESSGRSVGFGEVAAAAAARPVPEDVPLRQRGGLGPVGRPTGPVDAEAIVTGRARYGLDVASPGLLVAVVERAPVHGGRVESFDAEAARAVPGVVDVLEVEPRVISGVLYGAVRAGVAVVADDTWAALRGREALRVTWRHGDHEDVSTGSIRQRLDDALERAPDAVLREEGDPAAARRRGVRRIRARYHAPLLAHACMEPVNFTADATGERVVLRGPTQNPRSLQAVVARGFEIPVERVDVRPTLAGGGFGRRLAFDYGVEAAFLSRRLGRAVKVVWTREDDVRQDYYRPPSAHALEATLDAEGMPVAWRHHLATGSLLEHIRGPGAEPAPVYDVQGGADLPYRVPRIEFAYSKVPVGVQLGSWRSVAHSFNVFAVECFLDEVARAGGIDPLGLRLGLLPGDGPVEISLPLPGRRGSPAPDHARLRAVLREATRISGWGSEAGSGRALGLACCYYKETYAAHVAEVAVPASGEGRPGESGPPRIRRVWAAVDCGRVVNPDGVRAQAEGAAMDAAATVLHWQVTLEDGRVEQSNFHDLPPLRIGEAPEVAVRVVESDRPPSGMGEPPYPSAVAAIVNAVSAATGRRVRSLPVARG